MVIDYSELCAFVEARSARRKELVSFILITVGESAEPSGEALTQADVEAGLYLVEDYLTDKGMATDFGALPQDGQPAHSPIWSMLGYR